MIIKKGDARLEQICTDIETGTELIELKQLMMSQMVKHKGIGLAANQIGILKRAFVMATENYTGFIVNPVITKRTETLKLSPEGCLSVPNKKVKVKRNYKIVVEGFDENWNPLILNLKKTSAYCAQHEIDHLNGITI